MTLDPDRNCHAFIRAGRDMVPEWRRTGRLRLALLGGVSALALAGVPAPALATCAGTAQSLTAATGSPILTNGGAITITSAGTAGGGVDALTCGATTIGNAGTIAATGAVSVSGVSAAVAGKSSTAIGTLTNSGGIVARFTGINNTGTIGAITNTGTISGLAYAISSSGSLGPISNAGLISGGIQVTGQTLSITGGAGAVYGTLAGGTIAVSGGSLSLAGNLALQDDIAAGLVTGSANLTLSAKQTITGNYAPTGGSLIITAGTSAAGGLVVSGSAAMAGATVTFDPLAGFSPATSASYVLVDAAVAGTSYAGDILAQPAGYTGLLSTLITGGRDELIFTIAGSGNNNIIPGQTIWKASFLGNTLNPVFQGGTIRMDQPGFVYSGGFTVAAGGTGTIDQYGNTSSFSGGISNAGAGTPGNLSITNSLTGGEVIFNGTNTYTGNTTVNAGAMLGVNGSLASAVTVGAGGELRGTGTLGGGITVLSGGTLAPGNSPGTMTVTAPVTLAAGSYTGFDIDGTGTGTGYGTGCNQAGPNCNATTGNYSRLLVTGAGGTLSAGGTLVPLLRGITGGASNTYTPPIGQAFQVITAAGGLTGRFSGLTQPAGLSADTRFDALYGAISLVLVVTPASYATYAGADWAAPAAAGLDAGRPAAGVAMTAGQEAVYAPLYALGADQIVPALRQIVPVIYADTLMVNRKSFQMVEGAVDSHLQARRGAPPASGSQTAEGPDGATIWLGGSGQFVRQNTAGNGTPGYTGSAGGVVAGIDKAVLPGLRAGIAAGFGSQSVSAPNAASYQGTSAQVLLYAGYRLGAAFVDAQLGTTFDQGTVRRAMPVYNAEINHALDATGTGGSVRGGVRLAAGG